MLLKKRQKKIVLFFQNNRLKSTEMPKNVQIEHKTEKMSLLFAILSAGSVFEMAGSKKIN